MLILDHDGRPLTEATLASCGCDRGFTVAAAADERALFDYFFCRGGRTVGLGCAKDRARLETRWADGRRVWMLVVQSSTESRDRMLAGNDDGV